MSLFGLEVHTDEEGMVYALQLAQQAYDSGEVPVGAILVQEKKIIGQGYNSPITTLDPTAHAEIVAIRDAAQNVGNYRLINSILYVTLEPCSMCAGAIVHSRIDKVVFGATEPKAGALCSAAEFFNSEFLNHQPKFYGGVLEQECSKIMSDFFSMRREAKKSLKQPLTD